jgi:serine/threonine protein kinase
MSRIWMLAVCWAQLKGRLCNSEVPADQLWLAPEQLGEGSWAGGPQADIWSIGLLMFLCMGGTYPFAGDTLEQMVYNMASPRVSPKTLAYLPSFTGQIIERVPEA